VCCGARVEGGRRRKRPKTRRRRTRGRSSKSLVCKNTGGKGRIKYCLFRAAAEEEGEAKEEEEEEEGIKVFSKLTQ